MSERISVHPRRYLEHLLVGGYRLDRILGIGGFAGVYHARRFNGTEAAIKILLSEDPQAIKRFNREIKVMQSLPESPHLVRYIGHGETEDERPFLAMEYVRGQTLSQKLKAQPQVFQEKAAVVLYQISLALQALHRYGIVHRDVKPNNVLMEEGGVVKLFDFGLVLDSEGMLKLFEEEDILAGRDFAEDIERGAIAGTPEYMAPEQFSSALNGGTPMGKLTPATDIFAVGVILFRLLTGHLPLKIHRKGRPVSSKDIKKYMRERTRIIRKGLPKPECTDNALWSILSRALSEHPSSRQPNSQALSSELDGYLTLGTGTRYQEEIATQVTSVGSSLLPGSRKNSF